MILSKIVSGEKKASGFRVQGTGKRRKWRRRAYKGVKGIKGIKGVKGVRGVEGVRDAGIAKTGQPLDYCRVHARN